VVKSFITLGQGGIIKREGEHERFNFAVSREVGVEGNIDN